VRQQTRLGAAHDLDSADRKDTIRFMGQLVLQAIEGLQDMAALRENSNDSIWIAGDLLSRFHTNGGFKSGFAPIDAETVTDEDAKQLQRALLDALDKCTLLATRASLFWVLRNVRDPHLRPIYVEQLEEALRSIEGGSSLIHACLDCLYTLGEDVYEQEDGSISQNVMDIEKNWRQARKYVEGLNPTMLMPFPLDSKFPKDDQ